MLGPIERHSAQLRVDDNTTLDQLKDFSDAAGGNEKLRGKKNNDGSITLYSTDRDAKFGKKISGKAAKRSQLGREAIATVLRNVANNKPEALGHVSQIKNLTGQNLDRSANSDTLSQIVKLMNADAGGDAPGMADLPNAGATTKQAMQALTHRVGVAINEGKHVDFTTGAFKQELRNLGKALANDFAAANVGTDFPDLETSRGDRIRQQMTDFMADDLGPMLKGQLPKGTLSRAANAAFGQAVSRETGMHFAKDGALKIGGETYARRRDLGEGAYGKVVQFTAPSGKSVAVKFITDSAKPEKARLDTLAEYEAHQRAEGAGHANVLSMHGLSRTEDGSLAMVIDLAEHGDASGLMDSVKAHVADGTLSPELAMKARLMAIRDMAAGMQHLHANNVSHLDFKPANVFVDANGVSKLADFGNAGGDEARYELFEPLDSPYWQAPEVLSGKPAARTINPPKAEAHQKAAHELSEMFSNDYRRGKAFPQTFQIDGNLLSPIAVGNRLDARAAAMTEAGIDPMAHDAWALGVSIYNMFFESTLLPEGAQDFQTDEADAIVRFAESGVAPIGTHAGALHATTGSAELDGLINGLMKGDPSERISVADALNHPALNAGFLTQNTAETENVRQLVSALAADSTAQLDLAKAAFD